MKKFKVGQDLKVRSICDYDCIFRAKVLDRTAKFITVLVKGRKEPVRVKVIEYNGAETIYPFGRYSMTKRFSANQ